MKKLTSGRKRLINNTITYAIVIAAFVILQVLNAGDMLSSSLQGQLVPICAYIVMALSLNLVVGISGELSLGHAGFMAGGGPPRPPLPSAGAAAPRPTPAHLRVRPNFLDSP